jgi:hypothetical protein
MAIEFVVVAIGDNSIRTSLYDVRMRENQTYKRAELAIPKGDDPTAAAAAAIDSLWANGTTISAAAYVGARERQYLDYYKGVQLAAQGALSLGGTLAQINAAGLAALGSNDAKIAEWQAYKAAVGATTEWDIHVAMMLFCLIGRQAGGG